MCSIVLLLFFLLSLMFLRFIHIDTCSSSSLNFYKVFFLYGRMDIYVSNFYSYKLLQWAYTYILYTCYKSFAKLRDWSVQIIALSTNLQLYQVLMLHLVLLPVVPECILLYYLSVFPDHTFLLIFGSWSNILLIWFSFIWVVWAWTSAYLLYIFFKNIQLQYAH